MYCRRTRFFLTWMLQSTAHTDLTIACTALLLGILLILSQHRHILSSRRRKRLSKGIKRKRKKRRDKRVFRALQKEREYTRERFVSLFLHYYISIPLLQYTEETHLVQEIERWERIGVFAHSFWSSC